MDREQSNLMFAWIAAPIDLNILGFVSILVVPNSIQTFRYYQKDLIQVILKADEL